MALEQDRLQKPFSQLAKLLKKVPKKPSPEKVHEIRTRTRRVEAALRALSLDRKQNGKQVLKAVTPVRKRAGKVRDMDVLTAFASTLDESSDSECLVRLLEYIGHKRFKAARKLHDVAFKKRSAATQSLKRCAFSVKRNLERNKGRTTWPMDTAASALQLSGELASWPKLTAGNLHPFRLKMKELRNVLRLSGKDSQLVTVLGEVKDAIGEWHDWTELANVAKNVLKHPGHCRIQQQIGAEVKRRLERAMTLASRMRDEYFPQPHSGKGRGSRLMPMRAEVLKASADLVA